MTDPDSFCIKMKTLAQDVHSRMSIISKWYTIVNLLCSTFYQQLIKKKRIQLEAGINLVGATDKAAKWYGVILDRTIIDILNSYFLLKQAFYINKMFYITWGISCLLFKLSISGFKRTCWSADGTNPKIKEDVESLCKEIERRWRYVIVTGLQTTLKT